jgi:hypothetical protein
LEDAQDAGVVEALTPPPPAWRVVVDQLGGWGAGARRAENKIVKEAADRCGGGADSTRKARTRDWLTFHAGYAV